MCQARGEARFQNVESQIQEWRLKHKQKAKAAEVRMNVKGESKN